MRAGLAAHTAYYAWSSVAAHCRDCPGPCDAGTSPGLSLLAPCQTIRDSLLSKDFPPSGVVDDWAQWLRTEYDDDVARIRTTTRTGRPCGGKQFLAQLEGLLGRTMHPNKRGRKPKATAKIARIEVSNS